MIQTARLPTWIVWVGAILACEIVGILGSVYTAPAIATWYSTLEKSSLNPPGWVFGPVWTILYALMGTAFFYVWRATSPRHKKIAYLFFGLQLVLNAIWSPIFFGMHELFFAFVDLVAMWLCIVLTIGAFARVSRTAAWLLVPYLVWVTFAGYLNFSIWQLNPKHTGIDLPVGYSLDSYTIAEVLPTPCELESECETPARYLIRSNCPYTSKCIHKHCTVICPQHF